MINNDSIVTAYDEHLTLVEWLQKIEKLLANGGLKSTALNDKGNATFSLTLTFNDDTTITSPDMTLTSVNEALTDLKDYRGFDLDHILERQNIVMYGENVVLDNITLPRSFDGTLTEEQVNNIFAKVKRAVKMGYVLDDINIENNTFTINPIQFCSYSDTNIIAIFGGSDVNISQFGNGYYIEVNKTSKSLQIIYGQI